MSIEIKNNKTLFWISVIFFISFSIIYIVQWRSLNENIRNFKTQQNLLILKQNARSEFEPYQLDYKKLGNNRIIIKTSEFKKINDHVSFLAEQVSDESKRTQDLINTDLDRLNLYMAIGIGFMTILGIIVPVLVNVLNFQDLKEKQKELDEEQKTIKKVFDDNKEPVKKAIKDSNEAISKSQQALDLTNKINATEERVEKLDLSTAKISTLILQQAINRYVNVIPYIVINFDKNKFISVIDGVKAGFVECDSNPNHSIIKDDTLKTVISDFSYEINSARSLSVAINKEMYDLYVELSMALKNHINVKNTSEEIWSNKSILSILDKLIDAVTKYYAKTESTIK